MSESPTPSSDWERGFEHLSEVQRYCRSYIASWKGGPTTLAHLLSGALFMRTVTALNSVAVLVYNNCVDDAAMIVRALFEIEFQIGAIKKDPEVAGQLIGP